MQYHIRLFIALFKHFLNSWPVRVEDSICIDRGCDEERIVMYDEVKA